MRATIPAMKVRNYDWKRVGVAATSWRQMQRAAGALWKIARKHIPHLLEAMK